MIDEKLFTILPIYRRLTDQHHRRPGFAGELGDVVTAPLWCPQKRLLPFQFRQPSTWREITSITLIPLGSLVGDDIIGDIPLHDLSHDTADGYTYVTYFGAQDLTTEMECGIYYLQLHDGENTFFSEVFTVVDITVGSVSLSPNDTDPYFVNSVDELIIN